MAVPENPGPARVGRLYTSEQMVAAAVAEAPRALTFQGSTVADWRAWRPKFRRALLGELGPFPPAVPLAPEVLSEDDLGDVVRRKVVFDADRYASIPAYLIVPKGLRPGERRPGILCAHGHGVGKDSVAGVSEEEYQHGIALRLARAGYVTLCPDWRCFGERKDSDAWVRRPSRDGCNVAYLAHGYFGYQLLGLNVHDGKVCLDYLQSLPEVQGNRLGMIGCSFGGTMTSYVSALDARVKVSIPVCYLSTLKDALVDRTMNTCGVQFAFGLLKHGEIADVFGLIAPRACMPQIGKDDKCFVYDDAMAAARHLARVYQAAGVPEQLDIHDFEGGHEIDVDAAMGFFRERL